MTTIRGVLEQSDPVYWSPTTALEYVAAVLTTLMWLAVGIGLYRYWRASAPSNGAVLVLIGAVGVSVAAVGNLLQDVFDVQPAEWLFLIGLSVGTLALVVAGIMILLGGGHSRWIGLFMILWVPGGIAPDKWGMFMAGFSLVGLGIWLLRAVVGEETKST